MIWSQFGGRTRWCSSFDSWARALAKLAVTNEFSSFRLARRFTIKKQFFFIQENAAESIVCDMAAILPKRWVKLFFVAVSDYLQKQCPP